VVLLCATISGCVASCLVRVNQVGYEAGSKNLTAVALCTAAPSSSTFSLINSGGTSVYSGKASADAGSWSTTYPHTYHLVFSTSTVGTYTLSFDGASSPAFKIDTAANLYSKLLGYSVFFYQAQRDGADVISTVLNRKPSHLTDSTATVYKIPTYKDDTLQGSLVSLNSKVNVSGGWFDAGDFIKFVQTASYVVDVMLLSVRDHPLLFKQGGQADLYSEAKFGLDWLMNMWDDKDGILYYQVGIGNGNDKITADHDVWRLPEKDDQLDVKSGDAEYYIKYRPVFANANAQAKAPISPNLAGRVAAAFALCYQVYAKSLATFASDCLNYAEDVWALANTNPSGQLLTTSPYDFYPETEWRDDLELGATELFFATKLAAQNGRKTKQSASYYLSAAGTWASNYISKGDADYLNLYDVGALAHYELFRALNVSSVDDVDESSPLSSHSKKSIDASVTQKQLVDAISTLVSDALTTSKKDPFGFGLDYASAGDLVPEAFGLAIMADLLRELDSSAYSKYKDLAASQVDWLFGKNAWGTTFMIGAGSVFSHCPQHQVANLAGHLDGTPPILYGAVPDGPSDSDNFSDLGIPDGGKTCPTTKTDEFKAFTGKGVRYMDNVEAWPSVEPADDYSVLAPYLLARYIDV